MGSTSSFVEWNRRVLLSRKSLSTLMPNMAWVLISHWTLAKCRLFRVIVSRYSLWVVLHLSLRVLVLEIKTQCMAICIIMVTKTSLRFLPTFWKTVFDNLILIVRKFSFLLTKRYWWKNFSPMSTKNKLISTQLWWVLPIKGFLPEPLTWPQLAKL